MTTQLLDTFVDTNGTSLFSHTPDVDVVGSGWQLIHPLVGAGAAFEIQSDQLEVPINPNPEIQPSMALIDSGVSDFQIRGTFASGGNSVSSIFFRAQDYDNWLSFELEREPFGSIILRKNVGGVVTIIASAVTGDFGAGTVEFEIICEGSSIIARDLTNDNELTATSTANQNNTSVGFGDTASATLWNIDCILVRGFSSARDVQVEAVMVQQPSGIGTQDIVAPEFGDVVPKGVLFFYSSAEIPGSGVGPDGNHFPDAMFGCGAGDGFHQWALSMTAPDASIPTATARTQSSASIIRLVDPGGVAAVVAEATFECFIAGGVRIDWQTVHTLEFSIIAVFFAGDNDCDVNCGQHEYFESAANPVFLGFTPDLVVAATVDDGQDPNSTTQGIGGFGFQDFATGINQHGMLWRAAVHPSESDIETFRSNRLTCGYQGNTPNTRIQYVLGSMDDEMDLEFTPENVFGSSELGFYMAIRADNVQVKVGTVVSPQLPGGWKVDLPGFEPQFVMLSLGNQPTLEQDDDPDDVVLGVGVMTDSFQASLMTNMENNQTVAPTNQSYLTDTNALAITEAADPSVQLYLGEWLAFHSLGWTLGVSQVESPVVEEQWGYLAIEATTSQIPVVDEDPDCVPNPWTAD